MDPRVIPLLIILPVYGVLACLERVPAVRFKRSPFLRPFFQTDVLWYLATVGIAIGFAPVFAALAGPRMSAGIPGVEMLALPFAAQLLLALVLIDLWAYVAHVAAHRYEALWRIHKVHHSTRTLDWLATARTHSAELLFRLVPIQALLFAFGFPALAVAGATGIIGASGAFTHSNLRLNLRWLEPVFVTPRLHRLHHIPETTKRNLGGVFSVWDRVTGRLVVRSAGPEEVLGVPGEVHSYPQAWSAQLRAPFRPARSRALEPSLGAPS